MQFDRGPHCNLKFLFGDISRRIITRRVPLLRERLHPLNQPGIGFDCQLKGFNRLDMMTRLDRCTITGCPQCNVGGCPSRAECRLKAPILGESGHIRVL